MFSLQSPGLSAIKIVQTTSLLQESGIKKVLSSVFLPSSVFFFTFNAWHRLFLIELWTCGCFISSVVQHPLQLKSVKVQFAAIKFMVLNTSHEQKFGFKHSPILLLFSFRFSLQSDLCTHSSISRLHSLFFLLKIVFQICWGKFHRTIFNEDTITNFLKIYLKQESTWNRIMLCFSLSERPWPLHIIKMKQNVD